MEGRRTKDRGGGLRSLPKEFIWLLAWPSGIWYNLVTCLELMSHVRLNRSRRPDWRRGN